MLDWLALAAVVALNVLFVALILRYVWLRMREAEEREGPGEERRYIDSYYAERRNR